MKKIYSIIFVLLASFLVLPSASLAAFKDVPTYHPYYEEVMYLLENNVVEDSTNYRVSNSVTREEVAVMVAKAVGLDGTPRATKFKDVPKSNPNSGYIQSAADQGILGGYPDRTFKPNTPVTRGQMAVFIANAFDLPTGTKSFKDVKYGTTGYEQIKQLVAAGITAGFGDGEFKPYNQLTRGQISVFLTRAMQYREVQNSPGTSRNNAAKINETVKIDADDWLNGKQKFELILTDVLDGPEAWSIIENENMFNDKPEPGMKYVMAKFKVTVLSLEKEPYEIYNPMFDAVSENGVMYNNFVSVVIPSPELDTELYEGASYEGWTYFMIDENDSAKIVFNQGWESEAWFDLGL